MSTISRPTSSALKQFLYGIHPVLSAIFFKQRIIKKLYIRSDLSNQRNTHEILSKWLERIQNAAFHAQLPIVQMSSSRLSELVNGRAHQGVVLEAGQIPVDPFCQRTVSQLLNGHAAGLQNCAFGVVRRHIRPFVLLIDHLTDVMNFGSILRSAVFFGASALLLSPSPCVGPSPLVSKLSVGALESLPLFRLTDVTSDLQLLTDAGFLIIGTAGTSECGPLERIPIPSWLLTPKEVGLHDDGGTGITPRPMVLALGSESRGLSEEVLQACHLLVRVVGSQESLMDPTSGYSPIPSSLNVAVAAGILLYQLTRLRHGFQAAGNSCFRI